MHTERSWERETAGQRSLLALSPDKGPAFAVLSDRGGREENQDAWGLGPARDGGHVFCVADGLGGHVGGRIAAQCAVRAVLDQVRAPCFSGPDAAGLAGIMEAAQRAILARQKEEPVLFHMRAALAVLLVNEDRAAWSHVGDVRLYLLRQGGIVQRTLDHSVPQMLVSLGEIQESAIRGHQDRNRLTQALGNAETPPRPSCAEERGLRPGDCFLMASDGFWELTPDEDIRLLGGSRPEALARALAQAEARLRAVAGETCFDNYTALAVRLPGAAPGRPAGLLQ